ncbi:MAG: indole-3-glycerol phosphate synthase TrpC, partial [Solirubrobacteraceae bacterium]
ARRRAVADPPRRLADALRRPGISVIAEHKRSSPSAGVIRGDLVLSDVVRAYERGGAAAVSVLTEPHSFSGSLDDLGEARASVRLPILRKDFIVDSYQVVESVARGADAILLIVAALSPPELENLYREAASLGLGVLVEVHDRRELELAAASGADIIGINNRDLTTLKVDTARTFELLDGMPDGAVVVSESGWRSRHDLDRLASAGVDAVLVGEALMRAPDIESACRTLSGARTASRV